MKMEQWKDITGYEGLYQVSNLGKIKSIGVFRKNRSDGSGYMMPEKIMRPSRSKKGYLRIVLLGKTFLLHRIVATEFIPNPLNLPQVNHKDGDKTNCADDNLEWSTVSDNLKHSFRILGRVKRNGSKSISKILNGDIICTYESAKIAQEKTGIDSSTISKVCRGIKKSAGGFQWKFNQ